MVGRLEARAVTHAVAEKPQATLCGLFGIQQANGASGHIASIGIQWLPLLTASKVQLSQVAVGHVDFTAHFEQWWWLASELPGNLSNGADIVGDIISNLSIATCNRTHQLSAFIYDCRRHAVNFELHNPFDRLLRNTTEALLYASKKPAQLSQAIGIIDRQHRQTVLDLL